MANTYHDERFLSVTLGMLVTSADFGKFIASAHGGTYRAPVLAAAA
jgi:hypothetical protein